MASTLDSKLKSANEKLKKASLHLHLEERGGWLSLRGILPPKPGSDRTNDFQQRIPLRLAANPQGIQQALAMAYEIRGLLDRGKFEWEPFLSDKRGDSAQFDGLVERLGEIYRQEGGKAETWQNEYFSIFQKIPDWEKPLDLAECRGIILGFDPTRRVRKRTALAFARLADLAGLDHDFRQLVGDYSSNEPINPRDLPSDKLIAEWFTKIPNREYQFAYALQAIYGLRNYEVFKLNFDEFPVVFVNKGKTKEERYTYPIYPEWIEAWLGDGSNIILPNCNGSNRYLGSAITHAFSRYEVPFNPYDLRHSWARRSVEFGWDQTLAAAQMGHTMAVHTKIYQHWIKRDTYQKAYNILVNRPDRPVAPL